MSLKISTWLLVFLVSLLAFQASAQTGKGMVIFADAVYHNGKIVTVDERFSVSPRLLPCAMAKSWPSAATAEILALAGPKTLPTGPEG